MSIRNSSIVVVDDEPDNLAILAANLEDDYEVRTFSSGTSCFNEIESLEGSDLFLLDVCMPEMDGYELCRAIKNNPKIAHIPVVFVSALEQTEDIMKGYETGCDDYITKPISADEVLEKVKSHVTRAKKLKSYRAAEKQQIEALNQGIVKTSLNQIYEMGLILKFYEECFEFKTTAEVAEGMLMLFDQLYLESVVQIRSLFGVSTLGAAADSLETRLIDKYSASSCNDVHISTRSIFKKENVSVLIKNMPVEDEDKYGRYKDHIQTAISGASKRIASLDKEQSELEGKYWRISAALENCQTEYANIESMLSKQGMESNDLFNELLISLEEMLLTLGLEEDQEQSLISLVEDNGERLDSFSERSRELLHQFSDNFNRIIEEIKKI